jgi:hypothetical protein
MSAGLPLWPHAAMIGSPRKIRNKWILRRFSEVIVAG